MKICIFIKDVSLTGGTERVTVNLSSLFSKMGHDVTIISYYHGKNPMTYQPEDNVKVIYLLNTKCPDKGYKLTRIRLFFRALKELKIYLRNKGVDNNTIIISQNFFSNTLMWLAGNAKNTIGCEHFKYDLYPKLINYIRCYIYSHLKCIVTLTEKDQKRFIEHIDAQKTATIANMVIAKEGVGPNLNSKNIIAIGRLTAQKGFDMLIEAMKTVVQKHPKWTVNIFGEGEDKIMLQNLINSSNLQNNIILRGYSSNIDSELCKSSLFVLSSRFEGFPLVLVEALGQGMPSVAFDCPEGPAQLLETGGGILVEKENVPKLAEAICYMIEHPEFRKSCIEHKNYIRKHLAPSVIYNKWMELFHRLGYN